FFKLVGENGHHGRVSVHSGEGQAGDVRLRRGWQLRVDVHPLLDAGVHVSLHLLARVLVRRRHIFVLSGGWRCGANVSGCKIRGWVHVLTTQANQLVRVHCLWSAFICVR
ncbi:unnamed protein product, partial [Ectocarpus sp. 8 AP-2014]